MCVSVAQSVTRVSSFISEHITSYLTLPLGVQVTLHSCTWFHPLRLEVDRNLQEPGALTVAVAQVSVGGQQHVFAPGRWKLPLVYPRENFPQVNQSPADLHVLGMQEKPEPALNIRRC